MAWLDVPAALAELRAGRMLIVTDAADRENEGDLVMAAEHVSADAVNFMTRNGRGLVCVALTPERLDALDLAPMVEVNTARLGTAFTVSVDAMVGTTTGISAHDRAVTIRALVDAATHPEDLARPGHIFPLAAEPGGVLTRPGHTEAAVDLARLAGLAPAGVICEILAEDGTMARGAALAEFAETHGLQRLAIADLIAWLRQRGGPLVERLATSPLPTEFGLFQLTAFRELGGSGATHLALVSGSPGRGEPVLVRLHSECLTGDVFGSRRCDCGAQLTAALRMVAAEGGAVLYLRQEGRGIGLADKVRAYALQDAGLDTVEANEHLGHPPDSRDYSAAAAMLSALGIDQVRLLTNNPAKVAALETWGIAVVERLPLIVGQTPDNGRYLGTKRDKLGHLLNPVDVAVTP